MRIRLLAALIIISSCNKEVVHTTPIEANGEILFISRRTAGSADWQMFLMSADGTDQRLVSQNFVQCAKPVLSSNRNKIAFTTYDASYYYNLCIVDKDGHNLKFLSKGKGFCGNPAWSPDDNTIAFIKNDNVPVGDSYNVYSIDISTGNETKLTDQNNNFTPSFITNNDIVFSAAGDTFTGIYKMKADGSEKQLLSPQHRSFSNPVVSPDRAKIAITSNDWSGSQIFVMNADGSNVKQLTFTASPDYFDIGFPRNGNNNPAWSPDSKAIAYVSHENGSPDIFKINPDGTGNKRLTDTPLRDEDPGWTADGRYIIFSSNRNLNVSSEIYIMKNTGELQTALTNDISDDIYPTFIKK